MAEKSSEQCKRIRRIILNDRKLEIEIDEAGVIMNVNTVFELIKKAKELTKNDTSKNSKKGKLKTSVAKPRKHCRVQVVAFEYYKERAKLFQNDPREGITKYLGLFDSMHDAANRFSMPKSDIIAVANTWRPFQKVDGLTDIRIFPEYNDKKNLWYAEEGTTWDRAWGRPKLRKVVFFRVDEMPKFILDMQDRYIPPCVKYFKKCK